MSVKFNTAFLFTSVLLASCGSDRPKAVHHIDIEEAFREDFYSFTADAESHEAMDSVMSNLQQLESIKASSITDVEDAIGECDIRGKTRRITVDSTYQGSRLQMKTLLYHELGHCLLDLTHAYGEADIMNEVIAPITEEEWPSFVDSLFDKDRRHWNDI
jgi:hypothetical protein